MRSWPVFLAIPLVVGFGVAEGLRSNRWQLSHATEEAAARLRTVPLKVGDWECQTQELDAQQIAKGKIAGYTLRQYLHRPTGATLSVMLVCGRPGPMSVHTPEACYPGAGFAQIETAERHLLKLDESADPMEFWIGHFQKTGPVPEVLRIYWAWSADGPWRAPDHPRFTFAAVEALYKLYVVRPLAKADEPVEEDTTKDFLRIFLPEVQRCLFSQDSKSKNQG